MHGNKDENAHGMKFTHHYRASKSRKQRKPSPGSDNFQHAAVQSGVDDVPEAPEGPQPKAVR